MSSFLNALIALLYFIHFGLFYLLLFLVARKCGGILKGSKGEFTSPNYPKDYPNDQNCKWIIIGEPKKRIKLEFKSFSFEGVLCLWAF